MNTLVSIPVQMDEPYTPQVAMQHVVTGKLVICHARPYTGMESGAETCAAGLEKEGFTRVQTLPVRAAFHDMREPIGFPARRWHEQDTVPRW